MDEIFEFFNDINVEEFEAQAPTTRASRRIRNRVENFVKWNDFEFFSDTKKWSEITTRTLSNSIL